MTPAELDEKYASGGTLTRDELERWWQWRHREMTRAQAKRKGGRR